MQEVRILSPVEAHSSEIAAPSFVPAAPSQIRPQSRTVLRDCIRSLRQRPPVSLFSLQAEKWAVTAAESLQLRSVAELVDLCRGKGLINADNLVPLPPMSRAEALQLMLAALRHGLKRLSSVETATVQLSDVHSVLAADTRCDRVFTLSPLKSLSDACQALLASGHLQHAKQDYLLQLSRGLLCSFSF